MEAATMCNVPRVPIVPRATVPACRARQAIRAPTQALSALRPAHLPATVPRDPVQPKHALRTTIAAPPLPRCVRQAPTVLLAQQLPPRARQASSARQVTARPSAATCLVSIVPPVRVLPRAVLPDRIVPHTLLRLRSVLPAAIVLPQQVRLLRARLVATVLQVHPPRRPVPPATIAAMRRPSQAVLLGRIAPQTPRRLPRAPQDPTVPQVSMALRHVHRPATVHLAARTHPGFLAREAADATHLQPHHARQVSTAPQATLLLFFAPWGRTALPL